ncbi:MAG: FG-GAP-like repeat-containing protein [Phreatobacter sp.]|uniref:FG-GAP-like repeat-containing protein n=1 Tax=Phreatobacter sp. TaxID=1966341 RepID=UPI0027359AE1|nr:FG-GAP-like repeat-containing protein [Phreatobacter sp.]MDP2804194.1 FG-GAP-like repeat-containing protein [Phreatobacter sp.]
MPLQPTLTVQVGPNLVFSPGIFGNSEFWAEYHVSGLQTGGFLTGYVIGGGRAITHPYYSVGLTISDGFPGTSYTSVTAQDQVISTLARGPLPSVDFIAGPGGVGFVQTGVTERLQLTNYPFGWVNTSDAIDIWGGLLSANGSRRSGSLALSTDSSFDQTDAHITASWVGAGGYLATWQDSSASFDGEHDGYGNSLSNIVGRAFDAAGNALCGPFIVNSPGFQSGRQSEPDVMALDNGNYVVTWVDEAGRDGAGSGLFARVFDRSGNAVTSEVQLNQGAVGDQKHPSLQSLGNGSFAAVWTSQTGANSGYTTFVRVFNADGSPVGAEVQVGVLPSATGADPHITGVQGGGFVVTFAGMDQNLTDRPYFRLFDANGQPMGDQQRIGSDTAVGSADVTTLADGRLAITYVDNATYSNTATLQATIYDPRTTGINLSGTSMDDSYVGSAFADTLRGLGGVDHLDGGGGDDLLVGGGGSRADLASAISSQGRLGAEWQAVGVGNLSGAGHDDLVWTSAGRVSIWDLTTATFRDAAGSMGTEWGLAGIGEFNGDGRDDLFWTDDKGNASIWTMNGGQVAGFRVSAGHMGVEWHVGGIGHLEGPGTDQVVWVDRQNNVAIWDMGGGDITGLKVSDGHMGTEWGLAGIGDLNGDRFDDLVWQRADGGLSIWSMNGAHVAGLAVIAGHSGSDWRLATITDTNGDGHADLVWTSGGKVDIWTMNGATVTGTHLLAGSMGSNWTLLGPGTAATGAAADLIWTTQGSGATANTWLLNATGDVLTGGSGADTFQFNALVQGPGVEITDFNVGEGDRLDIHNLLASVGLAGTDPLASCLVRAVGSASGTAVQIDTSLTAHHGDWANIAILDNLTPAQVYASYFIF